MNAARTGETRCAGQTNSSSVATGTFGKFTFAANGHERDRDWLPADKTARSLHLDPQRDSPLSSPLATGYGHRS